MEDGHAATLPVLQLIECQVAAIICKSRYRNPIVLPIGCRNIVLP